MKTQRTRITRIPLENTDKGATIDERLPAQESSINMFPKFPRKNFPILIIAVAAGVAVIGIAVVRYIAIARELSKIKTDPKKVAEITQEEQKKLVEEVGKLIALPPDETPTVATVTDVEKLRNQPFFAAAENGDKVLIFTQAKKAYLYRPDAHKVIDVAPITFEATSAAGTTNIAGEPLATPTPAVYTVVLRNGTTTTGLTRTFEAALSEKEPGFRVTGRENAVRSDYEKTILIDVAGDKETLAGQFASKLGMETGILPDGEPAPQADFLIILGTDVEE